MRVFEGWEAGMHRQVAGYGARRAPVTGKPDPDAWMRDMTVGEVECRTNAAGVPFVRCTGQLARALFESRFARKIKWFQERGCYRVDAPAEDVHAWAASVREGVRTRTIESQDPVSPGETAFLVEGGRVVRSVVQVRVERHKDVDPRTRMYVPALCRVREMLPHERAAYDVRKAVDDAESARIKARRDADETLEAALRVAVDDVFRHGVPFEEKRAPGRWLSPIRGWDIYMEDEGGALIAVTGDYLALGGYERVLTYHRLEAGDVAARHVARVLEAVAARATLR